MVCCRGLKFITRLEYKYTQVTVDIFCENVTLFHCSVVVYNYILPFFLCLKECVIFWNLDRSTMSCGLTRAIRLTKHKPTAQCTSLLVCMKCNTFDGDPFTRWSRSSENKVLNRRIVICQSQE